MPKANRAVRDSDQAVEGGNPQTGQISGVGDAVDPRREENRPRFIVQVSKEEATGDDSSNHLARGFSQ